MSSTFIIRAASKPRKDLSKDKSFYVDEDDGYWCVFGDNSGHAYSSHESESEAKSALKKRQKDFEDSKK
jgi:hypothetical protein